MEDAHDEHSVTIPDVKNGNAKDANLVLKRLGINKKMANTAEGASDVAPNVIGMGAKDAVYALESRGLKVRMQGKGKVKHQSYPAGKAIVEGAECVLTLEH